MGDMSERLITMLSVYKLFWSYSCGGCWEAGGQDGLPCEGCWSLRDTPPLWCCTWPSINKQMKGSPWRSGELSWPICRGDLSAHGDPKWPPAASACQAASNLVFSDGQEGRRGERGGGLGWGHKGGHELPSLPPCRWLVWVTKWSRESTQALIINLSGSNRIPSILAPQYPCPPSCSPPLGGSPCRPACLYGGGGNVGGGGPILWDCTTVIIQLCSLFFSVKRPWYHYHLMNIYNWILAGASPWSDEYHSLFIRPLLILL